MGLQSALHLPPARKRSTAFSDEDIKGIAALEPSLIAEWTRSIAHQRGITVRHLPNQAFIQAVSRLSDGIVDLDPVEDLLIALGRAGVLTAWQRGLLQIHYLR